MSARAALPAGPAECAHATTLTAAAVAAVLATLIATVIATGIATGIGTVVGTSMIHASDRSHGRRSLRSS